MDAGWDEMRVGGGHLQVLLISTPQKKTVRFMELNYGMYRSSNQAPGFHRAEKAVSVDQYPRHAS